MKAIEMMKDNENLGWCKPYATPDEKTWVVVSEGMASIIIDAGKTTYGATDKQIEALAKRLNEDFDLYSGYDPLHILIEGMEGQYFGLRGHHAERGCSECPFRDVCDAVNEDVKAYDVFICGGDRDGEIIGEFAEREEAIRAAEKWNEENDVDIDSDYSTAITDPWGDLVEY